MENQSISVMDRHMLNNRGFTLIEMLFVVSIMIIISSFSFVYHKKNINTKEQVSLISGIFYEAKMRALVNKRKVICEVYQDKIVMNDNDYKKTVILNKGYFFRNRHMFSYNEKGHIKIAKTLVLRTPYNEVRFVFQVGSGVFYVK